MLRDVGTEARAVREAVEAEPEVAAEPEVVEVRRSGCPDCRGNRDRYDARHSRIPGECRWSDIEEIRWECPACRLYRPREHEDHTYDERCRWSLAGVRVVGERATSGRRITRRAADPRTRTSVEPTAGLRPDPDPGLEEPVLEPAPDQSALAMLT